MSNITQQILQEVVEFINAYRSGESQEIIDLHSLAIKNSYSVLKSDNLIKDFYQSINQEFSDDPELYTLLLSVIYKVVMDEDSIVEVLQVLCQEKIDLFTTVNIRTQIEMCIFRNYKINNNYRLRRKLHRSLVLRLENILKLDLPYRQVNSRNDKRIVIVTNQILGDLHAPTNITKEICYVLQKNLGMEILLIVAVEDMDYNRMEQVWFDSLGMNYIKEYTGNFIIERHNEKIKGYQIIMNQNNLFEIRKLVEEVYNYNPVCVWYMGNLTLFADLFCQYTTVLGMPFTDGYAISEAQMMVYYLNSKSDKVKEMEAYLQETKQTPVPYEINIPVKQSNLTYSRSSYNLKDDDFAIAIVGNRLDAEITGEFISFLKHMLLIDSRIVIVFIGSYNNYMSLQKDKAFKDRTKQLGFQEDLVGVLSMMDLFLNPPRQGGGTGAVYSLCNGVPVVTLDNCDVANFVNKEDVCTNEEEMLELIHKYLSDPSYYEKQSKEARKIQEKLNNDKMTSDTKLMLDKVKDIIFRQE